MFDSTPEVNDSLVVAIARAMQYAKERTGDDIMVSPLYVALVADYMVSCGWPYINLGGHSLAQNAFRQVDKE
jgi:hypothetical protein